LTSSLLPLAGSILEIPPSAIRNMVFWSLSHSRLPLLAFKVASILVSLVRRFRITRLSGNRPRISASCTASSRSSIPRMRISMRFSLTTISLRKSWEATQSLTPRTRLIGGFREDRHEALDQRACVGATMCPTGSPYQNDTKGATDRRWLTSGFGRLERDLAAGGIGTLYAGVGHVERFPDYWERLRQSPTTLKSAFLSTRPEKTTQLDTGVLWGGNSWSGSLSAFYGKVQDYILIRWSPTPALTRNVDATTMGGEASFAYRLARSLKTDVTLAYVRANNQSDGKPLAQQPPLETRLGVNYENRTVSFGALARVTGRQDRVDIGSGNIVANGMDIGPTGGFAIFSFNGAYRPRRSLLFTGGVDNLLNRAYAEHISRAGAMVPGFIQTTRINEPGRTFWLKVNFDVD